MHIEQYKKQFYKYMFANLNQYRELLQKLILKYMYEYFFVDSQNKWKNNLLVFMWWTNLRLCYNLPRWSEDLDFAYIWNKNEFAFSSMVNYVVKKLRQINLIDVDAKKVNKNTNVWKSFYVFSFKTITNKTLKIKLEVDVNPPQWWQIIYNTVYSNVNYQPFVHSFNYKILSYNLDTTFMWKIGAILGRPYVKWRDIFDIWWYLNNLYLIQSLNFSYLNSVIEQINNASVWKKLAKFSLDNNWKMQFINFLQQKSFNLIKTKKQEILKDVLPFILDEWTRNIFLAELETGSFLLKANQLLNLPVI